MRGSVDSAEASSLLVYSRRARLFARCLERTRSSRVAWDARRSFEEESTSAVLILVNVSCRTRKDVYASHDPYSLEGNENSMTSKSCILFRTTVFFVLELIDLVTCKA